MRIYAVADIHGRPGRIEMIRKNAGRLKADVIVVAGDLTRLLRPDLVVAQLSVMPAPVLVVRGNSDRRSVEAHVSESRNIRSLHLNRVTISGVPFVGVSGTVPVPFRTRLGFKERDLLDRLGELVDEETVLVTHPPPHGTLDRVFGLFHAGSPGLAELVTAKRPRILICGHIHESAGSELLGPTLVVNGSIGRGGGGVLIEIGESGGVRADMVSAE